MLCATGLAPTMYHILMSTSRKSMLLRRSPVHVKKIDENDALFSIYQIYTYLTGRRDLGSISCLKLPCSSSHGYGRHSKQF